MSTRSAARCGRASRVAVEDVAPNLTIGPNAGALLQLRDLERAIGVLPEEQRQVILLVGLEGMRYEEVAVVLDIPIGTVRSRLSRGREMLRRLMDMKQEGLLEPTHTGTGTGGCDRAEREPRLDRVRRRDDHEDRSRAKLGRRLTRPCFPAEKQLSLTVVLVAGRGSAW